MSCVYDKANSADPFFLDPVDIDWGPVEPDAQGGLIPRDQFERFYENLKAINDGTFKAVDFNPVLDYQFATVDNSHPIVEPLGPHPDMRWWWINQQNMKADEPIIVCATTAPAHEDK